MPWEWVGFDLKFIKPLAERRPGPASSPARAGRPRLVLLMILLMGLTSAARAEEAPLDNPAEPRTQLDSDETHPIYAISSAWVTSVLIGSAGLFLAAMLIGPIVKAEAPQAVPAAMSHEEDPAVDQH
jgi:hypothetical protein